MRKLNFFISKNFKLYISYLKSTTRQYQQKPTSYDRDDDIEKSFETTKKILFKILILFIYSVKIYAVSC